MIIYTIKELALTSNGYIICIMIFQIITLFPELVEEYFKHGMMRKAIEQGDIEVRVINLRNFGIGPRKKVDDIPYGGGDGMVLMPEPIYKAIQHAKSYDPSAKVLLPTPRGVTWVQSTAKEYSQVNHGYIIFCARYEGYDERIMELIDFQISIGDYVLTGGELPAMLLVDSITRLIPGVLGGDTSAELESFSVPGKKEHPHYTRPAEYSGQNVPEVLLNGNHAAIDKWREDNSIYE